MATANSCSTLQNRALKSVKGFLLKANEFTKENEHLLEVLAEIAKILEGLVNEKELACTDIQRIEKIKKFCESLLFGSLIELIMKIAENFSIMGEIERNQKENKQSNLPEVMQIKYDEVKRYLEKAKGRKEAIDKMLSELVPKIREACRKKFKIPDEDITDLEMDAEDVNCELEACKKYLEEAEKVIVMLESDINEELLRFGITIVAGAAGVASAVLFAGAVSTDLRAVAQQAYARLGTGGFAAASSLAGLSFVLKLGLTIHNHRKSFMSHLETLKSELREAKTEYDITKKRVHTQVTERMGRKH